MLENIFAFRRCAYSSLKDLVQNSTVVEFKRNDMIIK